MTLQHLIYSLIPYLQKAKMEISV